MARFPWPKGTIVTPKFSLSSNYDNYKADLLGEAPKRGEYYTIRRSIQPTTRKKFVLLNEALLHRRDALGELCWNARAFKVAESRRDEKKIYA